MDRPSIETRWALMRRVATAAGEPSQPAPLFEAINAALGQVAGHKRDDRGRGQDRAEAPPRGLASSCVARI